MNSPIQRRILVVDDNRAIHQDFAKILGPATQSSNLDALDAEIFGGAAPDAAAAVAPLNFEVCFASQGEEGAAMVEAATSAGKPFLVAFVDMRMPPGWDGVRTIRRIWEIDPGMQCVICTAYSEYSWEDILEQLGLSDKLLLLKKPFDPAEVCQLACALTEKWHLARHAHLKLEQLRAMVAEQTSKLAESEARYALAAAGANDGLWDWNLVTDEVFYAPRWNAILGLASDEPTVAYIERWLERVHPDDRARVQHALDALRTGTQSQLGLEYRARHQDGQYRWVSCRGAVRCGQDGKPIRAAGSQTDITDRKVAETQLQFDALHDALTRLPNRTLLRRSIGHCIAHRKRNAEFRYAVMFIDLDRFKVINDSLGHMVGDALLVELARRFSACVRATDTIAPFESGSGVARLGGDEFVVLLEGFKHEGDVLRVAQRLLDSTKSPIVCGKHTLTAGLSIGIAIGKADYDNAEDVLRDADIALYRVKGSGRGRYELFRPEHHAAAATRFQIENELRRGIELGEFVLHYQPIVSLASGAAQYFEALLRWMHPERGCVLPGEFIQVAEESGLIGPLGDFVLEEACRQLVEWRSRGFEAAINVNVSSRQFAQADFVGKLQSLLSNHGLSPQSLRIEVTESAIMDQDAIERCRRVAALGVFIYLDDFGTGYSSLSYLTRLPVHALKIDHSFISKVTVDPASATIVRTILMLATSLKLSVVAEGIETRDQAQKLLEMGCPLAQGYLWSKPVEAEQAIRFVVGARAAAEVPAVETPGVVATVLPTSRPVLTGARERSALDQAVGQGRPRPESTEAGPGAGGAPRPGS
jgi:diguanylate cyclase (GGDEF)-like protein/PAS domain S-box-containing protein